jgi:hypothetical protein
LLALSERNVDFAGFQPLVNARRHLGLSQVGIKRLTFEHFLLEERQQYENLRALKQGTAQPVARHAPVPSGFKDWIAKCWQQIDATVRRWLKTV